MTNKVIAVDARPLSRGMSGIRRYTQELLRSLVKYEGVSWLLFSDYPIENQGELWSLPNVSCQFVSHKWYARLLWPFFISRCLFQCRPDVYWSPRHHLPFFASSNTSLIVTIHDLVWLENKDTMPLWAYLSERLWMKHSINKADCILTVSTTTRSRIRDFFRNLKAPVYVIRNAYRPPRESVRPKLYTVASNLSHFLAVGTLEPRKNYNVMIDAYMAYIEKGGVNPLLIVGSSGWREGVKQVVSDSELLRGRVHFLNNLTDEEMRWCYENAEAYISTSLNEGFGIPVIEAQYYGVPLILSDIEVYREVGGSGATFIEANNANGYTEAFFNVSRLNRGHIHERKYIWDDSANKIMAIFQS